MYLVIGKGAQVSLYALEPFVTMAVYLLPTTEMLSKERVSFIQGDWRKRGERGRKEEKEEEEEEEERKLEGRKGGRREGRWGRRGGRRGGRE